MPAPTTIECDISPARRLLGSLGPALLRTCLQAAAAGVRAAAIRHFRARNSEPARSDGFPRFGQSWPKSNFWSTVADSVGAVQITGDTATIPISSPALAHKAHPNPPPIKPKGSRKYLAIPANARAAAWAGMPRDFTAAGPLAFGYALTPEGHWRPALLARLPGRKHTQGAPQYWLIRSAQTSHDPRALPPASALQTAAERAARTALQLTAAGQP